jgi:transposase
MFTTAHQQTVILVCGPTDMRKSIDGLSNIVAYSLAQEPCSDKLFVFCNRQRDKLKILQWSSNGFWLHYKRLEQGVFQWPGIEDDELGLTVTTRQLNWLLDGLPLHLPQAHRAVEYHYHDC